MAIVSRLTGEDVSSRYEAVGSGNSGPVFSEYQAIDRVLNRDVRVCVLNAEYLSSQLADTLNAEYARVSRIAHPAIERVLDILSIKDTPAVVLEPRCGANLHDRIEKVGAFPVAYTLDIVISIAEALQAAHRSNVSHGNLQLSDVCLSTEGIVKVSGLGLLSTLQSVKAEDRPEEMRSLEAPSAGADLRSLGLLLFGLLAGRSKPTLDRAAEGPAAFNNSVPASLSNLCRRLVHPGSYASIDDALQDLRSIRDAVRSGRPMPVISPPIEPKENGAKSRAKTVTRRLLPVPEPIAPADGALVAGKPAEDLVTAPSTPTGPIRRSLSETAVPPAAASGRVRSERPERRRRSLLSQIVRTVFWFLFLVLLLPALGVGAFFYLTWLKTTPEVTVPDLRGYNVDDARAALGSHGLNLLVDPNGVFDNKIPPGEVLTQTPIPGQHTKAPRAIKVVLSRGTQTIHVPNVMGKPIDDAMKMMKAAGLHPENKGEMSSPTVPNGHVGRQWPPPGTIVSRDTEASLRVSAGPSEQDMEAISPSTPQDRTITLNIPADKPKTGLHWLSSALHGRNDHSIEIKEVSGGGDEKTLWRGTAAAGQKWEHVVTVDPFSELKVLLDNHPVQTRLDLPQPDETGHDMASANP